MLEPCVAVLRQREVHGEVGPALGGRGEPEFTGGHDHPLPYLAIPCEVLLDRLRIEVVGVAAQHVPGLVQARDLVRAEDAGSGGVEARADQLAGLHQVDVRQDVLGRCLGIPLRRHSVCELGQELGVRGTPAIVLESGKMLPGYQTADELIATLGLD